MKKLLTLACASLLASGCAVSSGSTNPCTASKCPARHCLLTYAQTGCTQADDFTVTAHKEGIEVSRLQADNCRRRPFVKRVKLKMPSEISNKRLLNPLFSRFVIIDYDGDNPVANWNGFPHDSRNCDAYR